MFLLNSCLGLFSAACSHSHPFSLSYGYNLPSSLTGILPRTLGFSPRLPVSVCGTGATSLSRCFSWQHGSLEFGFRRSSPSRLRIVKYGFAYTNSLHASTRIPIACSSYLLCHSIAHNDL